MSDDREIEAMAAISAAMKDLEAETAARVLRWANDRWRVKPPELLRNTVSQGAPSTGPDLIQFQEFHDLFDAAKPETSVENALVAAYWFQVCQKHADLESQQMNSALKNLGHPSTNITRDLDGLINRSPRLLMQVRKDGTTRQARRRYKLTTEGVRSVERMLGGNRDSVSNDNDA